MKSLRKEIGFVPQKGLLFSGTIESNIKFANDSLSDEAMKKAASIAQATEFIESNPWVILALSPKAAPMFPAARSSGSLLLARWQTIRISSSSTIASLLLTIRQTPPCAALSRKILRIRQSSSLLSASAPSQTPSKSSSWTMAKSPASARIRTCSIPARFIVKSLYPSFRRRNCKNE